MINKALMDALTTRKYPQVTPMLDKLYDLLDPDTRARHDCDLRSSCFSENFVDFIRNGKPERFWGYHLECICRSIPIERLLDAIEIVEPALRQDDVYATSENGLRDHPEAISLRIWHGVPGVACAHASWKTNGHLGIFESITDPEYICKLQEIGFLGALQNTYSIPFSEKKFPNPPKDTDPVYCDRQCTLYVANTWMRGQNNESQ